MREPENTPAGGNAGGTGLSGLSPQAKAAIARYRRLMGNVPEPEPGAAGESTPGSESGRSGAGAADTDPALARYLAERPPHHSPPRPAVPNHGRGPRAERPRSDEPSDAAAGRCPEAPREASPGTASDTGSGSGSDTCPHPENGPG